MRGIGGVTAMVFENHRREHCLHLCQVLLLSVGIVIRQRPGASASVSHIIENSYCWPRLSWIFLGDGACARDCCASRPGRCIVDPDRPRFGAA